MKSSKIIFISILAALSLSAVSCGNDIKPEGPDTGKEDLVLAPGNSMVIYEANPKVFASSDALKAIEGRLDEIQDLGVNVI